MPKRLAITISGAVSLGSYESGVLWEVLDAIAQHNADPATTDATRIVVDVLTGASAGGMTAIILTQKLLFNGGDFVGPYDNPVYNTWVKRISLAGLQATQADEPALHSIFSSNLIETISKETLTARWTSNPVPRQQRHPAAGDEIRVGVAVTNLNGIAYSYKVQPSGAFTYIDYGDQMTRDVIAATCDNPDFWEPLRQAAVACGAFPFAFRAQDVPRNATTETDDYQGENLVKWDGFKTFTYSDGGVFQNQPLGMAKNLVDMIDKHQDQVHRYYLFVSPHAKDPTTTDNFHEADADYMRLARRLIDVVMGQSGFQDWITAQDVNERIALLDLRAAGLEKAILDGEIDVPALATTADSLLKLFFPDGTHQPPGATGPETLDQAKNRIAEQYAAEMTALAGQAGRPESFRDAVLAFESAAGLGARDCMTIYGVTAMDTELAGAGLQAFLGFFDQEFRDHDYDLGRTHAQSVLNNAALSNPSAIGPIRYNPSPIRPIDHNLDGLKAAAAPPADIQSFKAGTRTRAEKMARELLGLVPGEVVHPVVALVVDEVLNRVIAKS